MEETINRMATLLKLLAVRELTKMRTERHKSQFAQEREIMLRNIVELEEAITGLVEAKKRQHDRKVKDVMEPIGGTD